VNYKLLLDAELVPPITRNRQPLSMVQQKSLFSATRIPGAVQDTVRMPYTEEWPGPSQARHIVVFFRGNIFRLDVLDEEGRPFLRDDLEAALQAVMAAGATRAAPGTSVGHLTTKARAEWAASRQALRAYHPGNADALDAVETALFCLCLEDFAPRDTLAACDHLLHGDSGNRWFDKAVSLIVFADGTAGINTEHCELDGITILDFVDAILGPSAEQHAPRPADRPHQAPAFDAVTFALDDNLRADIQAAADSFSAFAADTASTILSFEDFGATRAKQLKISPDAFVQLAYQLAHRRAKGLVGATYESIATRHFRHGRTEAMRVVTPEVLRFVAAMDDPDSDAAARRTAFRATQPFALYDTPGWRIMRNDYLSTSAVPSPSVQFLGFGSTSSECIGLAYVLRPHRLNIYLSTPRPEAAGMFAFVENLSAAVQELQDLLASEAEGSPAPEPSLA
jgi:carnitine O-acetyltransferase